MSEAHANVCDVKRDQAIDLGRGLAVLAMLWVHFVPGPDASASGWLSTLHAASVEWLDGLPAVWFVFLVGVTASVRDGSDAGRVLRRAIGLALLGFVFWRWSWPNDILVPIAAMTVLLVFVDAAGRRMRWSLFALLLVSVPVTTALWGEYAWTDVREDGTHEANHGWGWFTVRYFLLDGAYPLVPWLAFPLLGTLLAPLRGNARVLRGVMVVAALCIGVAVAVDRGWGDAYRGGVHAHLDITWQPTSLPFVLLWGGAAVLLQALLWLRALRGPLPVWCGPLQAVGRHSLSHYLVHTAGLYAAMRVWWPDEDWSSSVGIAAAVGYAAFAMIVSSRLQAAGRPGPVEALLGLCARRR